MSFLKSADAHKIEFNFLNGNLMVPAGPSIICSIEPTDGPWTPCII